MSPKARDIKERTNKWDIIKNKKLLHGKRKYQQNEKGMNFIGKYN